MFYTTNELRAKSWLDLAADCRQRSLYFMAAECERIAASFLN